MPSTFLGWAVAGAGLVIGAALANMAIKAIGARTGV
jgi:hypothetical protein